MEEYGLQQLCEMEGIKMVHLTALNLNWIPFSQLGSPQMKIEEPKVYKEEEKDGGESDLPYIYQTPAEIRKMANERKAKLGNFETIPRDVEEIKKFLQKAEKEGRIIWSNEKHPRKIYELLQKEIDSTPADIHLIFGYNHGIGPQYKFFNELILEGEDGLKLRGITHLAVEAFARGEKPSPSIPDILSDLFLNSDSETRKAKLVRLSTGDTQAFIDYYLQTGTEQALEVLKAYVKLTCRKESQTFCSDFIETLRIARGKYKVIASILSENKREDLEKKVPFWYLNYEALEAAAIDCVFQRFSSKKKEVILYASGPSHIEKLGLPKHIRHNDPNAKIVSILLSGGMYDNNFEFDWAVRELGWEDKTFAVVPEGYRELDIIVHLSTQGRSFVYKPGTPDRSGIMEFIIR